jgi:hypothetical protein
MGTPIRSALKSADTFEYVYDFGSSTKLRGRLLGTMKVEQQPAVAIVARNDAPLQPCSACGELAVVVCTGCQRVLCEQCTKAHKEACRWPTYLPLVNSPRAGVCAYSGE